MNRNASRNNISGVISVSCSCSFHLGLGSITWWKGKTIDNDENSFYSCCTEITLLRLHYERKKQANTHTSRLQTRARWVDYGINPSLFKSVWVANTLPSPPP